MPVRKRFSFAKAPRAVAHRIPATASAGKAIEDLPDYVKQQLFGPSALRKPSRRLPVRGSQRVEKIAVPPAAAALDQMETAASQIVARARVPVERLPQDVQQTNRALEQQAHRFHGAKVSLAWFPWRRLASPCADKFGYLTSPQDPERNEASVQCHD